MIPQLEQINVQAVEHISRAAQSVRDIWEYVDIQIEEYKEKCIIKEGLSKEELSREKILQKSMIIDRHQYDEIPDALKRYVLHRIICQAAGHEKDIGSVHVQALQELFRRQVGRKLQLPYEVMATRIYEGVRLAREGTEQMKVHDKKCQEQEGVFRFRIFERDPAVHAFPEKIYTKWFDYDIIKNTVETRHRQPGDILTINKNGGQQRLKKYFINEKISQEERDNIWLVADGHEIMWVVGYRQSQRYQVTEYTKNILEIQFCKGENYGRDSKSIS